MTVMLEAALQAGGRGWPVFFVNKNKVPFKDSHGHLDASADPVEIERQFHAHPRGQLALATGAIVVVDADGPGGQAELDAAAAPHGGMPATLQVLTARGRHWYFYPPPGVEIQGLNAKRPAGHDGVDVKGRKDGRGGFVMLPPSVNRNGVPYRWANNLPIAVMPAWLVGFIEQKRARERLLGKDGKPRVNKIVAAPVEWPALPRHLAPRAQRLVDREAALNRINELPDFLAALKELDSSCCYDDWFEIGAAIYAFDPGPNGLAIFKAFSWRSEAHRTEYHQNWCEKKWLEYAKSQLPPEKRHGVGYIYELAKAARKERLASGIPRTENNTPTNPPHINGVSEANGHTAVLPAQLLTRAPIRFVDFDADGVPRGTTTNAGIAIENLGICCRKDTFHEKMLVGGHAIQAWSGDLSDDAVHMLRKVIKRSYGFDPGEKNTRDSAVQLCLEHQFNPVVEYLDGLQWDGRERLGRWVVDYLGAPDTPLNRECGRLMLLAAVRRARRPGCKFDQIIILEGKEGTGKSTALRILAGDDNFSDQSILASGDKEQQEAACGVWIFEIAELAGMRRTDSERIKQFAARTEDRARPAYGRIRVDMKRRCIFVATTNEQTYLRSETGNRRFWPIETGRIDLAALARDRDQLWAEAAMHEARGISIVLEDAYRELARQLQASRMEDDGWIETIESWLGKQGGGSGAVVTSTSVMEVLGGALRLEPREIGQTEQNRAARALRRLGYSRMQIRDGKQRKWVYTSDTSDSGDTKTC